MTNLERATKHDQHNRAAARLILGDVRKYGGEGALVVVWARAIELKGAPPARPPEQERGQLSLELLEVSP